MIQHIDFHPAETRIGFDLRRLIQSSGTATADAGCDSAWTECTREPAPSVPDRIPLPTHAPVTTKGLFSSMPTRRSRMVGNSAALPVTLLARLLASMVAEPTPEAVGIPCRPGIFLVANRVEGAQPGFYGYDREHHAMWPVASLQPRRLSEQLMMQQDHAAAPAIIFTTIPLKSLANCFGDRGYRIGCLAAGFLIDRLYLAAEALNLYGSASGAFASASADRFLKLDGLTHTTVLGFVVGLPSGETASQ